jgi:hypothetical protein
MRLIKIFWRKKMKKNVLFCLVALIAASIVMVASCKSSSDGPVPRDPTDFVGSWSGTTPHDCPLPDASISMTVNSDKSFSLTVGTIVYLKGTVPSATTESINLSPTKFSQNNWATEIDKDTDPTDFATSVKGLMPQYPNISLHYDTFTGSSMNVGVTAAVVGYIYPVLMTKSGS